MSPEAVFATMEEPADSSGLRDHLDFLSSRGAAMATTDRERVDVLLKYQKNPAGIVLESQSLSNALMEGTRFQSVWVSWCRGASM